MERSLSTLATEMANPATSDIDRMTPLEIAQAINAEDAKVALAVQKVLPEIAQAIEEIAKRMRRGGRLIYVGAGTSGRLGALDASECPPTFNISPESVVACIAGGPIAFGLAHEDLEDNAGAGQADVAKLNLTEADIVVGITASGRTPYARGALAYARQQGALTIGLACNAAAPIVDEVDIMIAPEVGPEVIAGSTRLKAGTAQKMVLNMLSTGAMILLGKTFGNLMVDVQTSNYKLRKRALSIVRQATGLDEEAAEEMLERAGGETKTAILMARANLSAGEARQQLAAHGQVLRAALDALS
ncbi:MAG TPA: N-acetylmuramic acid 6-phosphate etherase [Ktedonobacteraceae bacterium]|jgi:N-acetylmuramic acid 6-phosphate etherase|nr:N-acetylmuramic acid 6-phosphate etherase [Ktedonobacteraceae bacterium]